MGYPTVTKTWTISACNRISYVSLIDLTQHLLYGVKAHLVAHGYTVLWSASAGTGPTNSSDHTDRWNVFGDITPRATIAAASQGWIVLTDGNAAQILITFQGATDDVARISFSPGALFTLAGTTTNQPTATDEQVIVTGSVVASTTSGDRLWSCWVDSTSKLFRVAIARSGSWVGLLWGVELLNPTTGTGVTFSPAIWGFVQSAASLTIGSGFFYNAFSVNNYGGLARPVVGGVGVNCLLGGSYECALGNGMATSSFGANILELNDSGYGMIAMGCATTTATARGKLGNRFDWWIGKGGAGHGDTYGGSLAFIAMGDLVWPWDGATTPVMT